MKSLETIYENFEKVIRNKDGFIESRKEQLGMSSSKKIIEKNMKFYNHKAKTGMSVVNIQDGEDFGLITNTNKYFWQLINYKKFEKARINHFLVK